MARSLPRPSDTVPLKVGDALRTTLPVPVEVVAPVPPLATGSVPVTPVVSGSPVAFVRVADAGVPKVGVISAGELLRTTLPVPVEVVVPVPPLATGSVPEAADTFTGGRILERVTIIMILWAVRP